MYNFTMSNDCTFAFSDILFKEQKQGNMFGEQKEKYKSAEKLELKDIKKDFPKVFKEVCCPSCNNTVPADNLNLTDKVAKCGECNIIFSIEEEVSSLNNKPKMNQEIFRPEGIDLFYFKDELDITVKQHVQGLDAIGLMIFPAIAFFSTLVYLKKETISVYIPLVTAIATIYFLYRWYTYEKGKNKTFINVSDKFLSIKSRPKHFRKDKHYHIDEIDQLYIKTSEDGMGYFSIYMIINGIEGQKHEKLLDVNTISKAKYLEQQIEKHLHIEDRKVPEATA